MGWWVWLNFCIHSTPQRVLIAPRWVWLWLQKLKNDPKLAKDAQALESELQVLQTQLNNKQAKLQRDHKEKIRSDLIKSSGMSEDEVHLFSIFSSSPSSSFSFCSPVTTPGDLSSGDERSCLPQIYFIVFFFFFFFSFTGDHTERPE